MLGPSCLHLCYLCFTHPHCCSHLATVATGHTAHGAHPPYNPTYSHASLLLPPPPCSFYLAALATLVLLGALLMARILPSLCKVSEQLCEASHAKLMVQLQPVVVEHFNLLGGCLVGVGKFTRFKSVDGVAWVGEQAGGRLCTETLQ